MGLIARTKATVFAALTAAFLFTGCAQKEAESDLEVPPPPQKAELTNLQASSETPAQE